MSSIEKLKQFGYNFNQEGKLRKLDKKTGSLTDIPFEFNVSSSHSENQANYDALGEIITEYVYDLLESNDLKRFYMPKDVPQNEASFFYCTLKEIQEVEKLLLIIQGSGVVRCGQWSRSLIINDSLDSGTVLPFIRKAQYENYTVIVTNTNENFRRGKALVGSSSPEQHVETLWNTFVREMNPNVISIVAHSYGGIVTSHLAKKFEDDFKKKVCAIAFTDSVHTKRYVTQRLKEVSVNFVTSKEPVNVLLSKSENDVEKRSAGTFKHELTSYSSINAIFNFIKQKESKFVIPETIF